MEDLLCRFDGHFLFGSLLVRAIRRGEGRPISGLKARIGPSIEDACGDG